MSGERASVILERFSNRERLDQLSRDFTYQLRLWDALEGNKREVIDFYLYPTPFGVQDIVEQLLADLKEDRLALPTKSERKVRLDKFREISEQLQNYPSIVSIDPLQMQAEFMAAKAEADVAYLERKLDILKDPFEYIERTQGLEPKLIGREDLQKQKAEVIRLFEAINGSLNKRNFKEYREETKVSPEEFLSIIQEEYIGMVEELAAFLGVDINTMIPKFNVEVDDKEAYWLNWSNGNSNQFTLHLNTHHIMKITSGKANAMNLHEIIGHFVQMKLWLNKLKNNEMIPVLGFTSVHDPEQMVCEGIAQTLHYFVPGIHERLSANGHFELELDGLRHMIYNNIHVMANSEHPGEQKLVEYVQRFLPMEPEQEILDQIRDRTKNTLYQSYLYAYGQGFLRLKQQALALNETGKRRLLEIIYSQPLTPQQELRVFETIRSDPSNVAAN